MKEVGLGWEWKAKVEMGKAGEQGSETRANRSAIVDIIGANIISVDVTSQSASARCTR